MAAHFVPVAGVDFVAAAAFILATAAHARRLYAQQRHAGARAAADGLARLAATIRAEGPRHGYDAELVLGAELAEADRCAAEILG